MMLSGRRPICWAITAAVFFSLSVSTFVHADEHPRILLDRNRVKQLKAEADSTHAVIWEQIRKYADTRVNHRPPNRPPNKATETYFRNSGDMLLPLALAWLVSGKEKYLDATKDYLLTYAKWDRWDEPNNRDIGQAHMMFGNAIAFDWVYNDLSIAERNKIGDSLATWTKKMYDASVDEEYKRAWNNWWSKSYMQNHCIIAHGSLGVASLVLLGEDNRAKTWLNHSIDVWTKMSYLLNCVSDGSWHEGVMYQGGALSIAMPFLISLRDSEGVDLIPHKHMENFAWWRLYNMIRNKPEFIMAYANFEWSWTDVESVWLLRFAAKEYNNRYAQWVADELIGTEGRWSDTFSAPWAALEFLAYDADYPAAFPTDIPKSRTFEDLEGVIWRTGWGGGELIFGLKAGAYGGRSAYDSYMQGQFPWEPPSRWTRCSLQVGHDHDDMNGFYLHFGGQWVAPETVSYGPVRTSLHNTLLIDGEGQFRPQDNSNGNCRETQARSDGFLESSASSRNYDYVAADATRRYRIGGLRDFTRHVVFIRPQMLLMVDNLEANSEHRYDWICHFDRGVSTSGDWIKGRTRSNQVLGIQVIRPSKFKTSTGNDGNNYVRVRPSRKESNVRLVHLLYPTVDDQWGSRPSTKLLAENDGGIAVRLTESGGASHDVMVYCAGNPTNTSLGVYDVTAKVAVLSKDPSGGLDKLFIYSGGSVFGPTHTKIAGTVRAVLEDRSQNLLLIRVSDASKPLEVAWVDDAVRVNGDAKTDVKLYAPKAEKLLVNNQKVSFKRFGKYIVFDCK